MKDLYAGLSQSNYWKYENQTSGGLKSELPGVWKSNGSKTDINNTDSSETDLIYSAQSGENISGEMREDERYRFYFQDKQSLYQDWKDGEITQQEYRDMKADYERQTSDISAVLTRLNAERAELANGVDNEHHRDENYIRADDKIQSHLKPFLLSGHQLLLDQHLCTFESEQQSDIYSLDRVSFVQSS